MYGINRIPADSDDDYYVTQQTIKALEKGIDPTAPPKRPGRKYLTCRHCGQSGYTGDHPFSTNPQSGLCDDCV